MSAFLLLFGYLVGAFLMVLLGSWVQGRSRYSSWPVLLLLGYTVGFWIAMSAFL